MRKYVVTDTESLRTLCIKNNWFTHGTNEQYCKLFEANSFELNAAEGQNAVYQISDVALIIWLCSGSITYSEIYNKLHDAHNLYMAREKKRWESDQALLPPAEDRKRKSTKLEDLKVGDIVKIAETTLGTKLPRYLESGPMTVIGFTKVGTVKCDWDGGASFNIPANMLIKLED